jgi:hypothetical protein
MKIHETMLHILYAKQNKDGIIEPDRHMNIDYLGVIEDLIKMGLITRDNGNLKFTILGLEKINYLREVRGLTE